MELRPPLHFGVVAIEKGAFGSPSTKDRQLYFLKKFNWLFWLFWFYGISTFVDYLMQNPFLYK